MSARSCAARRGASSVEMLRDVVGRKFAERAVTVVKPDDLLLTAHNRMRLYEFSQLPVIENERVVGIIDESDVLLAVHKDPGRFRQPVRDFMSRQLKTLDPSTPVEDVVGILDSGMAGMLYVDNQFYGLITKADLLNYIRRKLL